MWPFGPKGLDTSALISKYLSILNDLEESLEDAKAWPLVKISRERDLQ